MEKVYYVNESIEDISGVKSRYLYSLFRSICRVNKEYIQYTYFVSHNPDDIKSKEEESQVERVFAYELYHQWSNDIIIKDDPNLIINSELSKNLTDCNRNNHLYYPDMVLHIGQGAPKGNIIVCEIKRKEYIDTKPNEMVNDFKKLQIFLDGKTKAKPYLSNWEPYELGVFIAVVKAENCEDKLSVKMISKYFDEDIFKFDDCIKERIICVVYNGRELRYDTLINISKE